MSDFDATLAVLVGSRLCHDLISPVGAIQNGLELVGLSGGGDLGPEMTLIEDSATSVAARIRFFRVAFGGAGEGQSMSARDCAATLDGIAKGERLQGSWQVAGDQPRVAVQLAYLAHLCCESALPQGGRVTVTREGETWVIAGEGPRITADPVLWSHLAGAGSIDDITPDKVQFVLLSVLARARGRKLVTETGEAVLRIGIR